MVRPILLLLVLVSLDASGLATLSAAQAPKSSDLLTAKQAKELAANAKTPADHLKLNKHFVALAAKYDADADEHAALAEVYKKSPKRPRAEAALAPDTAGHCDRLAGLIRQAAKAALDLAADHERMAAAR